MNASERKKAAKIFIERWANRGNEKQDSQSFWLDLLQTVYGIENPTEYITFEDSVSNMMDSTSFIDGYIETTNVLIEPLFSRLCAILLHYLTLVVLDGLLRAILKSFIYMTWSNRILNRL